MSRIIYNMKTRLNIDEITSFHIDTLQGFNEPRIYNTATEIFYEGQIPHAGYLLIEGEIHFIKKSHSKSSCWSSFWYC